MEILLAFSCLSAISLADSGDATPPAPPPTEPPGEMTASPPEADGDIAAVEDPPLPSGEVP